MIDIKRPSEDVGVVYANSDEAVTTETLPCRLLIPRVNTFPFDVSLEPRPLSSDACSIENHPVVAFAITADGFFSATGAVHTATSYYIEDLDSNVYWASEYDTENLTVKHVEKLLLPENKVFRVKALFHSSTNDVSDASIKTFIPKRKNRTLKSYFEGIIGDIVFKGTDIYPKLNIPFDLAVTEVKIVIEEYNIDTRSVVLNTSVLVDNPYMFLDMTIFNPERFYYIYYKTIQYKEGLGRPDDNQLENRDVWECVSFSTFKPIPSTDPSNLKPLVVTVEPEDFIHGEKWVEVVREESKLEVLTDAEIFHATIRNISLPTHINIPNYDWVSNIPPFAIVNHIDLQTVKARNIVYDIRGNKPYTLLLSRFYNFKTMDARKVVKRFGYKPNSGNIIEVDITNVNQNTIVDTFDSFRLVLENVESLDVKFETQDNNFYITSTNYEVIESGMIVNTSIINVTPIGNIPSGSNRLLKFDMIITVDGDNSRVRHFELKY